MEEKIGKKVYVEAVITDIHIDKNGTTYNCNVNGYNIEFVSNQMLFDIPFEDEDDLK